VRLNETRRSHQQNDPQLASDLIKSMIHPKDEATNKKKIFKFGTPGQSLIKKPGGSFLRDMQRHGIMKDIEGVKALKNFLENSPTRSDGSDTNEALPARFKLINRSFGSDEAEEDKGRLVLKNKKPQQ